MPIYEFHCQTCGADFEELLLSTGQLASIECPECQSRLVQKKISLIASKARGNASPGLSASCTTST